MIDRKAEIEKAARAMWLHEENTARTSLALPPVEPLTGDTRWTRRISAATAAIEPLLDRLERFEKLLRGSETFVALGSIYCRSIGETDAVQEATELLANVRAAIGIDRS